MKKILVIMCWAVISSSCNMYEEITSSKDKTHAEATKVYEYTPAPGQFINEPKMGFDGKQTTAEAAARYAEGRLEKGLDISLGGFGGYIVVGFDHNVLNFPQYDFAVMTNAFDGSSEPAVVWVMKDENGNGLPDDTWYELAGSETGKAETVEGYAITYYRPSAPKMAVQWSDNLGVSGTIDYLEAHHKQDYYYPEWIEADSYTLVGTRLKARSYDDSGDGTYWVNPHFDWGYADNFSPEDFNTQDRSNRFDISNAINARGERVELDYINFVKVQSAINFQCGWIGEVSTEVRGFKDINFE
ncbi:MAG: hypothetical protein IIW38_03680 [Alistipes sp.]|nr:hypothetical protein [Alistipes sp.]